MPKPVVHAICRLWPASGSPKVRDCIHHSHNHWYCWWCCCYYRCYSYSYNNKVARASAAARGVSFMFGRFFGQKHDNPVFCEVFVNSTTFRCFRFPMFFVLVIGSIFSKVSQIPWFSCFVFVQFWGLHGRRVESQATSILKGPPKRVRHTAPQPSRKKSPKEKENTSRSRMDVITPPPPIPPPHPRIEFKDKCKSKLACAESRDVAKTLQIPIGNATQTGKHRKTRCETDS